MINLSRGEADRIKSIIDGVDAVATDMEFKWGVDRLRLLVDSDIRLRFDQQAIDFNAEVWPDDREPDVGRVDTQASGMIRGWQALDKVATQLGHEPLAPNIWSHTTQDGFKFAIAQGNADAIKAIRSDPELEGVAVYSLYEIGNLLAADNMALVNSVKDAFPGATVNDVKDTVLHNDEVPW